MPVIRYEEPGDVAAIHDVVRSAFPTEEEAMLIRNLRESGHLCVSLVAEEQGQVIGHIAFSPVTIDGQNGGLGLAPVCVKPAFQNQGIGGELVTQGLLAARRFGAGYVVVLGHSHYYPRFGFQNASALGFQNEYGAEESFMIMELEPGALPAGGLVKYCDEFQAWS